jgi:ribosomal protein L19E
MVAFAARNIYDAQRPLTLGEIFPEDGACFGKTISRSLQKVLLTNMRDDGLITETRKEGVSRWKTNDARRLLRVAAHALPVLPDPEEDTMSYHGSEADKKARCAVANRALRRLLEAKKHPETIEAQNQTMLFIAKKGDKYQQRQVLDKSWQTAFLRRLVDEDMLKVSDESGMDCYWIPAGQIAAIEGILNGTIEPCLHTLLWPDNPCTVNHAQNVPTDVQEIVDATSEDTELTPEEKAVGVEQAAAQVAEVLKDRGLSEEEQASVLSVLRDERKPEPTVETLKEDSDTKEETVKALEQIVGLIESQSNILLALSNGTKVSTDFYKKVLQEIGHVHSKLDKLHEENTILREGVTHANDGLNDMIDIVKDLATSINPEDNNAAVIRKRLGDLEKLASEHKKSLDTNNQLMRTSLAEAASAMVAQAAQVFVKQDQSEVLTKINTVEENLLDGQSRVNKTLNEVYEALEKVRAEYKNSSRMPVILERMGAISEELQRLQALLPDATPGE